jgi:hypothetical protein
MLRPEQLRRQSFWRLSEYGSIVLLNGLRKPATVSKFTCFLCVFSNLVFLYRAYYVTLSTLVLTHLLLALFT